MNETLYADSSAVVKRYRDEPGRDEAVRAMKEARAVATSQITFTEVARALLLDAPTASEVAIFKEWEADWRGHQVIELDQAIASHAASLAVYHRLGSLDALHLASALSLGGTPMRFATWDRRLAAAARAVGLRVVPASL